RAARATRQLLPPHPLRLETFVADELAPGLELPRDRVRVERIAPRLTDRADHVRYHTEKRAQRHRRLDAVLPSRPGAREHARDLAEVVEEEAARRVAELRRLAPPERVERREDALQLLGQRRRGHAPAADAEQLDLALERRIRVLVHRADDVGSRREVTVRIEPATGEAHEMRRIQLRVLRVDGDEQLDHLIRGEAIEDDGWHLHVLSLPGRDQLMQGEQAMLDVEGTEHALLRGY